MFRLTAVTTALVLNAAPGFVAPVLAQMEPAGTQAHREAIAKLDRLDGRWRGTATMTQPDGTVLTSVHTERVGPLLGGSVKVIEGRSYSPDGATGFNALAVISFSPGSGAYAMRTYLGGQPSDHPLSATPDGFEWSLQAGPNARVVYKAVIKDGTWREVGDYVAEGQPPRRFIELNLEWIGDSDWPTAGEVGPK